MRRGIAVGVALAGQMGMQLIRIRLIIAGATVGALALACVKSPGPPNKATTQQIDQMNQEIGSGSGSFGLAPDWAAMARKIQIATDSVEKRHWISEFAHHAVALPESLRIERLAELQQLMRERR